MQRAYACMPCAVNGDWLEPKKDWTMKHDDLDLRNEEVSNQSTHIRAPPWFGLKGGLKGLRVKTLGADFGSLVLITRETEFHER